MAVHLLSFLRRSLADLDGLPDAVLEIVTAYLPSQRAAALAVLRPTPSSLPSSSDIPSPRRHRRRCTVATVLTAVLAGAALALLVSFISWPALSTAHNAAQPTSPSSSTTSSYANEHATSASSSSEPAATKPAGWRSHLSSYLSSHAAFQLLRRKRESLPSSLSLSVSLLAQRLSLARQVHCHNASRSSSNPILRAITPPCTAADVSSGAPLSALLPHRLTLADVALLRVVRRDRVQRERASAKEKQPAVAFLFLSDPQDGAFPPEREWRKFFEGHENRFNLYLHFEPRRGSHTSGFFQAALVRSQASEPSHISRVDAQRRLLATALADPRNLRFVLLPAISIPARDYPSVWSYLFSTPHALMSSRADNSSAVAAMEPQVTDKTFREGSRWWVLSRHHAYAIINDDVIYDKFQQHCRMDRWHGFCDPEAHYVATVLQSVMPQEVLPLSSSPSSSSSSSSSSSASSSLVDEQPGCSAQRPSETLDSLRGTALAIQQQSCPKPPSPCTLFVSEQSPAISPLPLPSFCPAMLQLTLEAGSRVQ